ncbi:NAD(P)H-quinone oxidoreductase [Acidithiobacillus sp.]
MATEDETMKAVEITGPGGPDVLRLGDRPKPRPAAGEVLIRVAAAGVNRPDLSAIEAATLPEVCFTVWSNVFDRACLCPGELLLVHGGSSGIGVMAIQMARALGSRAIATAGTAEKCAACVQLGAELAINYKNDDFVNAVHRQTEGRGVDVVIDMMGGDYLQRNLSALAEEGRIIYINAMKGSQTSINLRDVMVKRLTVTGSILRSRPLDVKAAIAESLKKVIWPLIAMGKIKPILYRTYMLSEASSAHALMETSEHIGKIALTI